VTEKRKENSGPAIPGPGADTWALSYKKHQMQPILARRHVYEAGKINAYLGSRLWVCSHAPSTKFKKEFLRNSVSVFCTKFWEQFGVWAAPCSAPLKLILGILYKLKKSAYVETIAVRPRVNTGG
jgi:putative flippase GtrA